LGKVALLLLTLGVIAGYFRTRPFFRRNWRKFHVVNYIAFLAIILHSRNLGTDARTPPFVWVYWIAVIAVCLTLIYKLKPKYNIFPELKSRVFTPKQ